MDKFDNVEKNISSNPITNYTKIEHYDIGCKFHIKSSCFIFLSTIPCINTRKKNNWFQM
jgi:hypothetical protein